MQEVSLSSLMHEALFSGKKFYFLMQEVLLSHAGCLLPDAGEVLHSDAGSFILCI